MFKKQTILVPDLFEIDHFHIDSFFRNKNRYDVQMSQTWLTIGLISLANCCDPVVTNEEMGKKFSINGTPLDQNAPANPCGLVALSIFNDKYEMKDEDGTPITIDSSEIAWETDVKNKYDRPPNADSIQWHDTTDPHFMVWMRTAGMP